MPTLFGRQYVRRMENVGHTEKAMGILILLLVAAILVAFVVQSATDRDYLFNVNEKAYQAQVKADSVFPDPGLKGWKAPEHVDRFTADDLYLKINGRADAYLKFHVISLTFGTYYHRGDTDRSLDVYWYDMGEPGNAYAVYRSEAPPDATPMPIGREGYQVGGAVFFCKGSSYVQVLPGRLDDADAALHIAGRLAERIQDSDQTSTRESKAPSRPRGQPDDG